MSKRRLSRQDSLKLSRALYSVFFASDGRIAGDVANVADAVRRRGIRITDLMDLDPATIITQAENEYIRKRLRDLMYPIDGMSQRIYQFDGGAWLHMPLRLWLNTKDGSAPDAMLRRSELDEEIGGIIRQINPNLKSLRAKKKGWETTRKKVREGVEYEQPSLFSSERRSA